MRFFDLLWGWADYTPKDWSGPPLSVEEEPTCFVVRDHNGQKLAYVYFEDELARHRRNEAMDTRHGRRAAHKS